MSVIRSCRRCQRPYTSTRQGQRYCLDCAATAYDRVCAIPACGKHFRVHSPSQAGIYCSMQCVGEAKRSEVEVTCAVCSASFHEPRWKADHNKHFFCSREHRLEWGRRDVVEVVCRACDETRHYSPAHVPASADRASLTWTCKACRRQARIAVNTYTCEFCHEGFTRLYPQSDQSAPRFCSRDHYFAWKREHSTSFTSVVCAYCLRLELQAKDVNNKEAYERAFFTMRRHRLNTPAKHRFCNRAHRALYYQPFTVHARRCAHCDEIIKRRGETKYCKWACYVAARRGQPRPTRLTVDAERRIHAAREDGVRGIRPLARASGASVNTVKKLIKAGTIAS